MEVQSKKGTLQFAVDNPAEAVALYAVVFQHPEWTTPEMFAKAQTFWGHFCTKVQDLALYYDREMGVKKAG